jgi:hypothetical protein
MKKYQQSISLRAGEKVFIKAHATLDVEGWDKAELNIETDLNVQRIQRENDGLHLLFVDDATIRVPQHCRVVVLKATGNARIRTITGDLEIHSVDGNLAVQQAGRVKIDRVSGGALLQSIHGPLDIRSIGGNLKGKDCFEMVQIEKVNAAVELLSLHGGADIRAMGDIHVSFLADHTDSIRLRSAGDVFINLPFELDAEMRIKSNAHLTELVIGERMEKIQHRKHVLLVGDGRRKFDLEAGGKVRVVAEQIEDTEILKLFEELEMLWAELKKENKTRREARSAKPAEGAPEDGVPDEGIDVSLEEMQAAEKRVEAARAQVENRLHAMGYDAATQRTVVDQLPGERGDLTGERLIVVRLLSESKISIEEADKLLEALEG